MAKPVFKTTSKKGAADYTVAFEAGENIFEEGDLGTEMFILQEGKVEILKLLSGDHQQIAVLEKGDFFGEMSILEDLPRTATARAVTECKLLRIDGATFDQMLRTKPEIAVRIMRKLSRRLRQTDQMLKEALAAAGAPEHVSDVPEVVEKPKDSTANVGPQKLIHAQSGMTFYLAEEGETTIGRRDPVTGINPEIDLTAVDHQRSTSRRHAKVQRRDGHFFLTEEIGTMNGTFVNGLRIETGTPQEIQPGDEVQFGLVKLRFEVE
jgi:CRP-like cAMP-binding protein